MTEEEKRAHAERLIREHNADYEFCLVYEDEELEDESTSDQEDIHTLMYTAKLMVVWP